MRFERRSSDTSVYLTRAVRDRRAMRKVSPRQMLFTAPRLMSHLDPAEQRDVVDTSMKPVVWLWTSTRDRLCTVGGPQLRDGA